MTEATAAVEAVTDFIFLGSKITADSSDCSHEIKRCLLLGRKTMTKLDTVLKRKNITLLTKVHIAKTMIFPVIVCQCKLYHKESWALKNWLQRSNQSILKEINPEYSLEGLVLKLKLWSFGHLMQRGKDPNARKDWGREEKGATGWDGWMASLTQWTWFWANSGRWWGTGKPGMLQFMGSQRVWHDFTADERQQSASREAGSKSFFAKEKTKNLGQNLNYGRWESYNMKSNSMKQWLLKKSM